jgi:transcriptional regulator with GAF, ATPase, and Fis domain/tetratricopeptide (TPR) repeat protein
MELFRKRYKVIRILEKRIEYSRYLVRDRLLDRVLILKKCLLFSNLAQGDTPLKREFKILCSLRHPSLQKAFDYGLIFHKGIPTDEYFTVEYREGKDLLSASQGLKGEEIIKLFRAVLQALSYLHKKNIFHGNLKPTNIIIPSEALKQGDVFLIDFSASGYMSSSERGPRLSSLSYLAPEVIKGSKIDERAELYSLGAIFYEVLWGIPPYPEDIIFTACEGSPTLENIQKKVPEWFARMILRLISINPKDRYAQAKDVLSEVNQHLPSFKWKVPIRWEANLIGRNNEIKEFQECIAQFISSSQRNFAPKIFAVIGEPGIGKTRLLEEFKWIAQLAGAEVIKEELKADLPLSSSFWSQIFHHIRCLSQKVLCSLEEIKTTLLNIATERPLVLMFQDVHNLSPEIKNLLTKLCESLSSHHHILIVLSCEPDKEIDKFLKRVEHRKIELQDLSKEEVKIMLEDLFEKEEKEVLETVFAYSHGNPGLVHQAVYKEKGIVRPFKEKQREFVERLFSELDQVSKLCLKTVALFGRPLSSEEIIGFISSNKYKKEKILEALSSLVSLKFLVLTPENKFTFSRRFVLDVIISMISQNERILFHTRILNWLEENNVKDPVNLAYHAVEAEEIQRILRYLPKVAERFYLAGFTEKLLQLLEKAWNILLQTKKELTRIEINIALLLAEVYRKLGRFEKSLKVLEFLLNLSKLTEMNLKIRGQLAEVLNDMGEFKKAKEIISEALKEAEQEEAKGKLLGILGRIYLREGRYNEAENTVKQGTGLSLSLPSQCVMSYIRGIVAHKKGDSKKGIQEIESAISLARKIRDPYLEVQCTNALAIIYHEERIFDRASLYYEICEKIAKAQGLWGSLPLYLANTAAHHLDLGNLKGAFERLKECLSLLHEIKRGFLNIIVWENLAYLYIQIGAFFEAKDALNKAKELEIKRGDQRRIFPLLCAIEIALFSGKTEEAIRLAKDTLKLCEKKGTIEERAQVRNFLAEAYIIKGWAPEAVSMASEAIELISKKNWPEILSKGLLMLGLAKMNVPKAEKESLDYLERSLQHSKSQAAWNIRWQAHLGLAEFYKSRDPEQAKMHLMAAKGLLNEIACNVPPQFLNIFWQDPRRKRLLSLYQSEIDLRKDLKLEMFKIFKINEDLLQLKEIEPLLTTIIESAIEITKAKKAVLVLLEDGDLKIRITKNIEYKNIQELKSKISFSVIQNVIDTGNPLLTVVHTSSELPFFQRQRNIQELELRIILCVPICFQRETLGAIYLENKVIEGRFSDEDLEIIKSLAHQLGLALIRIRERDRLIEQSKEIKKLKEELERLYQKQSLELIHAQKNIEEKQHQLEFRYDYKGIIGRSPKIQSVLKTLDMITDTDLSVLITGESGTGKELCARALHYNGPRRGSPFVAVNCSAIPSALLMSELFGHIKGAFTGALSSRVGLFRKAHKGTILLDEIGDMPLEMQKVLLRVLEEGKVKPVGGDTGYEVDVRIIAATNQDIPKLIKEGKFRKDLYFRISKIHLSLPPLRERREDIPLLVDHFIESWSQRRGLPKKQISLSALRLLLEYEFPGNVRELENIILSAMFLSKGETIDVDHLLISSKSLLKSIKKSQKPIVSRYEALRDFEYQYILNALQDEKWNISRCAKRLGINRTTLYRTMKRLNISKNIYYK